MTEAFDLNQDNLLLQLKNMPKPPISKELAKEIGFDQKKYETIIEKLLVQISEVRRERMKENYLFNEKIKSMQIEGKNNDKKIVIKNNLKANKKKIILNRPKSNYKAVRSSGYGIEKKKIDIFSTRSKKNNNDNKINRKTTNNQINNINNKINKNNKLIPKSKTNYNNIIKKDNISNNNINNINNKGQQKNILINNKKFIIKNKNVIINDKNLNINNKKGNKNPTSNLNEIKNELNKIQNENLQLEEEYNKLKKQINASNALKANKKIFFKNNNELIKNNIEKISISIINGLLYELIDDLKYIEETKKEREKLKEREKMVIKQKKNINNKLIKIKFKAKPNKNLIDKCNLYRQNFYEHMKLKGSFIINDIFQIYDDFIEEICKEIMEEGLNYCIEQMDNFINKIQNQK